MFQQLGHQKNQETPFPACLWRQAGQTGPGQSCLSRYAQLKSSQTVSPQMAYGAREGLWLPTHPSPKQLGPGSRDWLGPPLCAWAAAMEGGSCSSAGQGKGCSGASLHLRWGSQPCLIAQSPRFGLTWLALEKQAGKAERRARRAWRIYDPGFPQKLWEEMGCWV